MMPFKSEEGNMRKKTIISLCAIVFCACGLWGGGWNNTLMGARALAMGAAFVGVADDASAIFYNPAGLVFQENRFNLAIDGFYVWPTHEYVMPTGTRVESQYNASMPQLFLTYKTSERLTIGFGAYIPFAGGGVDWKEDQLGVPLKSYLGVISLTPSISYQVNEQLSIGFNLNYYHSELEVDTVAETFGPMKAEESGSALSAGVGLMYKPSERLALGLNIRGPAKMELSGTTSISTFAPGFGDIKLKLDSETSFNLPWDFEMGLSYRLSDSFLLTTSAQYTMWSTLDKVDKTIKEIPSMDDPTNLFTYDLNVIEELNFNNILILRVGMEYLLPSGLALRGGLGVDRAATPAETLSITNIDVDKFTLLGGIGYRTGRMSIDFAFVRAFGKEREKSISQFGIPLMERYNLNVSIVGLGITYSY
jgi:long-chain fatty acid transport protein